MLKKQIEFTEQEQKVLLGLLDVLLKSTGKTFAKNIIYYFDKFEEAFVEEESVESKPTKKQ